MNQEPGRWILITGCSSGIGRDAALTLQQRGYRVIASVRRKESIDALQQELHQAHQELQQGHPELQQAGPAQVLQLDLSDSASIVQAVDQVLAISGGQLSALFNNGAYAIPGAVEDLSRDALRRQFETNLFGTVELTNRLLPTLLKQPDARIVQNSSVLGLVAMRYRGAYNASKFALEGITDTLRLELAGTSVRVILIEPGPILTRFRANSRAAFLHEIDYANSRFSVLYQKMLQRLEKEGAAVPFTLGPEAVTRALIRALEAPRPKARYPVTFPTRLFGTLRHLLPTSLMDKLVRRY